jgi:hypothetical protein
MPDDVPRFPRSIAAKASGMSVDTLATWMKRDMLPFIPDNGTAEIVDYGAGVGRLFTRRGIIRLAIVAKLARRGIPFDVAKRAAMTFADKGNGIAFYAGETDPKSRDSIRPAGHLFENGGTVLLIEFSQGEQVFISVMRRDQAETAVKWPENEGADFLFIDLEAIVRNVNAVIGTE